MKQTLITILLVFIYYYSFGQEKEATVEAEFDTIFHFQFESLKETNQKKKSNRSITQYHLFFIIWKGNSPRDAKNYE